jgi:type II secretory pathway pseudopilin PulG
VPIHADRRGISLLEAIVGLAMVGMTAVGALSAAGSELRAVERSRHAIEAAALASQRLSQLHLLTYNELLSLPDSVARGHFDPPLDDYRWTIGVSTREKEQGVFNVTLQVTWTNGVYNLASALYRRPPMVTQ